MFTQIKDVKAVTADIRKLRNNENSSRLIINTRVPEICIGIHAGDNIAVFNSVLQACAGHRQKEMFIFGQTMLPYHFDKEAFKFTSKFKDAEKVAEKEKALTEFLASGQTVFGWLALQVKVEKAEIDWETRFASSVKKAAAHLTPAKMLELYFSSVEGMTADQVLAVFADVANKAAIDAAVDQAA